MLANSLEWAGIGTTQLEVEAIEIADLEDGGRGRAKDADRRVGRLAERHRQVLEVGLDRGFLRSAGDQADQAAVRRHAILLPLGQLALRESLIVVPDR